MADTDSWFDRIPGGYYKDKTQPQQQPRQANDGYRRSNEYDDREAYYDDRYDRREKRRDSHRNSYERDNRRYSMGDNYRRSYDDEDRYDDRYARRDRRSPDDYQADRDMRENEAPVPTPAEAAAGGFAAGVAAAHQANEEAQAPNENSAQYSSYVPYSNIYGEDRGETARGEEPFSAPPRDSVGSPQPHSMNQVSPPRRMSVAQEAFPPPPPHYDGNASYDDDRYERERYPRAARPRLSRLRSSSYDSYDSRYTRRRPDDRYDRPSQSGSRLRGKSIPRGEKTFDGTARGLGYGAVGALAGGLLGSEFGGGTSTTIGAVLGGIGANMFEARERRKQVARAEELAYVDNMATRREQRRMGERRQNDNASWTS